MDGDDGRDRTGERGIGPLSGQALSQDLQRLRRARFAFVSGYTAELGAKGELAERCSEDDIDGGEIGNRHRSREGVASAAPIADPTTVRRGRFLFPSNVLPDMKVET